MYSSGNQRAKLHWLQAGFGPQAAYWEPLTYNNEILHDLLILSILQNLSDTKLKSTDEYLHITSQSEASNTIFVNLTSEKLTNSIPK